MGCLEEREWSCKVVEPTNSLDQINKRSNFLDQTLLKCLTLSSHKNSHALKCRHIFLKENNYIDKFSTTFKFY